MRVAVLATVAGLFAVGTCVAENPPVIVRKAVHIPAQLLGSALQTLGRERALQIIYRSEIVGSIRTSGAEGQLTIDEAMAQLLNGTGLTFHYLDDKTITIIPANVSSAANADADDQSDLIQLEEVIVTAQKMVEMASKTPLALSVYSGKTLAEQGVNSATELRNIAPGVGVGQSPAGVNLSIRGVGTTDVTSKGDQGVVFNIDGVPVGRPREMGLSFFDLERIEILRGPQGTLYGKSATGGTINVITAKPKDYFDAATSLEFGDYNARRGFAMVNMPAASGFAMRAAASFNLRDGYLNPVINSMPMVSATPARQDQNNLTGRLSGLWTFTGGASLLVTGTAGHVGGVGSLYSAIYKSVVTRTGAAAQAVYYNPLGGSVDDNFRNVDAELNVDLGMARITYVGAHRWFDAHDMPSSDSNPVGSLDAFGVPRYNWTNYRGTYVTDSHELRFSNAQPQRVEWVVGTNYFKEDIREHDQNWTAPITNPTVAGSVNATGILANTEHESSGLFAQVNLHATSDLKLTAGVRRSSDSVRRRGTFAAGATQPGTNLPWPDSQGQPCVAPSDCIGAPNNGDQSASKITYRFGADYQLDDRQMIYAYLATGYKAGGFNDYDSSTRGTKTYDPEQLTAYEVGYKGNLLPNLQFNSSAFYYDYAKTQISSVVAFFDVLPATFVLYTRTVPTVIYGWENELHYKMTEGDFLDVTLAMEKSHYKSFMAGVAQNVDWSGYGLDNTPSAATTLAYSHRWIMADGAYYEARLNNKYSSGYLVSDFNRAKQYRQRPFTLSDLSFAYGLASGKFEVRAYVRNIENKLQLLSAPANSNDLVVDAASVAVSEPRTYGIRFGLRY